MYKGRASIHYFYIYIELFIIKETAKIANCKAGVKRKFVYFEVDLVVWIFNQFTSLL